MVTLEMVLDPSGIRRGAAEAERELQRVGSAARQAGAAVDGIYTTIGSKSDTAARSVGNLSNAFQSVGGTIQVGQGITQTLAALERADVAGAGTNVARTLLEISKTGHDFRQLASGVGATGGAFTALRAVMTAHPILTIATAIGFASTAIGALVGNTREAVSEFGRLADGMRDIKAAQDVAIAFGDQGYAARGRQDEIAALRQAAVRFRAGNQSVGAQDLLGFLGSESSQSDLREVLESIQSGSTTRFGQDRQGRLGSVPINFDSLEVSPGNAVEVLRRRILFLESEARLNQPSVGDQAYDRAFAAYQRGAPQPNLDAIGGTRAPLTQYGPGADDWEQEQERRAAALEEFQQQVQELRQVGAQVGSTFASAFESIINKTNSAREAVEQLIRTLGSQVLQSVFQNLGASIAGGLAGSGPSGRTRSVDAPGWQQA